jgi:hypothetical protein
MSLSLSLRLKATLDRRVRVIALVFAVLLVTGSWATYVATAAPATTTEEVPGPAVVAVTSFEHAATVTVENPVYEVGTVLTDRPVYYGAVSPVLDGTFVYGVDVLAGSNTGTVTVVAEAASYLRSVERSRDGSVAVEYWRTGGVPLATANATLAPGERLTLPFTTNVSAATLRAIDLGTALGDATGDREVVVEVVLRTVGTPGGVDLDETRRFELPVRLGERYVVDAAAPARERFDAPPTTVTVERPREPVTGSLALSSAVVGALGLAALGGVRALSGGRPLLSETERRVVRFHADRDRYDDWIVTARLPAAVESLPGVEVDSIRALVDVASGTGSSVIETPGRARYVVVADEVSYVFDPVAAGALDADDTASTSSVTEDHDHGHRHAETDATADTHANASHAETHADTHDETHADETHADANDDVDEAVHDTDDADAEVGGAGDDGSR